MNQYIGLDVSIKETAISIRQDGKRIWRGKCGSDPQLLAAVIRKRAPHAQRVVFETGPLSVWFYHALTAEGLPAICVDARHAKAALDIAANKTDANDASIGSSGPCLSSLSFGHPGIPSSLQVLPQLVEQIGMVV